MKSSVLNKFNFFLSIMICLLQGQDTTSQYNLLTPTKKHNNEQAILLSLNGSYMTNDFFSISSQNVGIGYDAKFFKDNANVFIHTETGVSSVYLNGKNPERSLSVGGFSNIDIEFNKTSRRQHTMGIDFGYALGIPQSFNSQFDEHNFLLNIDYGYAFLSKYFSLIPYIRVESYAFIPRKYRRHIPFDGGMNAILGFKGMQTLDKLEWSFNIGAFSDFNLSGSSIGILADNTIIYDREGISNGGFGELAIAFVGFSNIELLAKLNCSYMFSYYEINTRGVLSFLYRF